jgi:putative SOS response-associated peptidase YedK
MCGRYSLSSPPELIAKLFELSAMPSYGPRFNIAPTQQVMIIRTRADGGREAAFVQWGLIPSWAKEAAIGSKMINARAESAAEKPAFREAFQHRRCLIPADGFFEWKKTGGRRQPMFVVRRDGAPMALAGLWERWRNPRGEDVETCAIITTEANSLLRDVHDRMPVILDRDDAGRWLNPALQEPAELQRLLRPAEAESLRLYPVSRRVNTPANDDDDCIKPLAEEESEASDEPDLFSGISPPS